MTKVPPNQLLILVVLIIGGLGFAGYKYMYTPAKAEQAAAQTELDSARSALGAAEEELQRVEAAGPDYAELSKVGVSSLAVPARPDEADALLELARLGRSSNIRILEWSAASQDQQAGLSPGEAAPSGPRAIALTVTGFARYPDLVDYIDRIESTVRVEDGKAYVRGRLFNVIDMKVSPAEATENADAAPNPVGIPLDGQNYVQYTLVIEIYTRSEPVAVDPLATGEPGADPAAAGGQAPAPGAGAPAADGATAPADGSTTPAPATADATPAGVS